MTTYKERKENKTNYVLLRDCVVIGTYGNLKKITENVEDDKFPSYWTLVRKSENPIEFGNYKIFKVKHY